MNIVWIKRDLRLQDHRPLFEAELSGEEYIIVYLFEPSIISYKDTSIRHLQFIYKSLKVMNDGLKNYNRSVCIYEKEALDTFKDLISKHTINTVYSYQESGIGITYERDKKLKSLFDRSRIKWCEYQRDGIVRGITNRKGWDKKWFATMKEKQIHNKYSKLSGSLKNHNYLSKSLINKLEDYSTEFQSPGEIEAHKLLNSFVETRGKNYSKYISKPAESRISCGRISPYLAWGNISVKQAYQYIKNHPNYNTNKRSFNGILTRLKWRDHFIQKFEIEWQIETRCANKGFETLRRRSDSDHIKAWMEGRTGVPMVDANMRCLIKTGWINFRMRAMLVSFLCHHLDCDWRLGVYHMAQLFLDYEPGIHYSQFQMQAGTTGINAIRIYNPVKQGLDHDPSGDFIKKWVPELKSFKSEYVHEPSKVPPLLMDLEMPDKNYPNPIVDVSLAANKARKKIWAHRKLESVKRENLRILSTHTRNS